MYNIYIYNNGVKTTLHEAETSSHIKATGTYKAAVNASDSFTFSIMPDNPCYDKITPRKTMIEMYNAQNGKRMFRGLVLKPTASMSTSGTVSKSYVCTGELDYLSDSIQPYSTVSGNNVTSQFLTKLLNQHNAQMPEGKKIYLGQVIASGDPRSHTWHYCTTYQALADYVRDYGGEFRLRYSGDKKYLDYTSTVWDSGSNTKIELAVNMRSVSYTLDSTAIATGVYPVGAKLSNEGDSAERLELGEVVWNAALRQQYGDIVTVVTWDDVTVKANLRTKAAEWLANQSGALHQYTVDALELSKINKNFDEFTVGTQYAIKNPLIGLDDIVRCIKKDIDINDSTKATMTFGDKYETLQAVIATQMAGLSTKIDDTAKDITKTQEAFVKSIVANQTALLTGAEGGYVYQRLNSDGEPQETFYLNSPDINTATQALRFNYKGIGFWDKSVSGGSALQGPYKDAWTIDGTLHTEFIVANRLVGLKVDNGDGTFKVDADGSVTAKALSITNGSINCGNGKFTVSPAGHVVAQDIELSGGSQQGGSFTNAAINCGNGKFVVTSGGNVTAQSINITGGSIDITTTSQTDDRFNLKYSDWSIAISPLEIVLYNSSTKRKIQMQAGGMFFYEGTKECLHIAQDGIDITNGNDTTMITSNSIICDGGAAFEGDVIVHSSAASRNFTVGDSLKILFDRTGGYPI